MLDLIVQGTGSMEAGGQFCRDNGVCKSDTPVVGTAYVVSDAALALGDAGVLAYLVQNEIVIGTMGGAAPAIYLSDDDGILLTDDSGTVLI